MTHAGRTTYLFSVIGCLLGLIVASLPASATSVILRPLDRPEWVVSAEEMNRVWKEVVGMTVADTMSVERSFLIPRDDTHSDYWFALKSPVVVTDHVPRLPEGKGLCSRTGLELWVERELIEGSSEPKLRLTYLIKRDYIAISAEFDTCTGPLDWVVVEDGLALVTPKAFIGLLRAQQLLAAGKAGQLVCNNTDNMAICNEFLRYLTDCPELEIGSIRMLRSGKVRRDYREYEVSLWRGPARVYPGVIIYVGAEYAAIKAVGDVPVNLRLDVALPDMK